MARLTRPGERGAQTQAAGGRPPTVARSPGRWARGRRRREGEGCSRPPRAGGPNMEPGAATGLRGRWVPGRRAWPLGHPGPQAAPDAGDCQPRTDAERGVQGGRGGKRAGKGGEGLGAGGGWPLRGPCPLWKIPLLNTSWKQQKGGRSSRDVPRRRSGGRSLEAARPTSFGLERTRQRLRGQLRSLPLRRR